MCGIAGFWGHNQYRSASIDDLSKMLARLEHRGPDDKGEWSDPDSQIALGQRRLAVIDLSSHGHQPMESHSGRYVVTYNGEIYNFEALRADLASAGITPNWRGHSDTEVMLAAIEAWGFEAALKRLTGMFAIALWDREKRTLSFARDRIGEKPLYYGIINARLFFASELKAFRAVVGQSLEIDRNALAQFMRFGYIPAPASIYRGIYKLPAAHFVEIGNLEAPLPAPRAYWELRAAETHAELRAQMAPADDRTIIDAVNDRLSASIRSQMVADVPLGAFLSGGVDSSAVVAVMQAQSALPVKSFTIGFEETGFDEAPFAKAVARHLGTDHTEMYVTGQDALDLIPALPQIYDEPFADSSQIPTTLVSRLTRQHVTVSLSGDGGDELFAGYPRYQLTTTLAKRMGRAPSWSRRLGSGALRLATPDQWDTLLSRILPASRFQDVNGRRMHRLAQLMVTDNVAEMYVRLMSQWNPEDGLVLGVTDFGMNPANNWPEAGSPIEAMRAWDVGQYLPDDLLVKVDRAAMFSSLEARAPMLDHHLIDLAFALPERALMRDGVGKWVLRQVLDRYVPRALIDRPKAGFAVPLGKWLRGPLRDWAAGLLDEKALRQQGYLDAPQVSAIWAEHLSGKFDRSTYLWNILMFQAWLECRG